MCSQEKNDLFKSRRLELFDSDLAYEKAFCKKSLL